MADSVPMHAKPPAAAIAPEMLANDVCSRFFFHCTFSLPLHSQHQAAPQAIQPSAATLENVDVRPS